MDVTRPVDGGSPGGASLDGGSAVESSTVDGRPDDDSADLPAVALVLASASPARLATLRSAGVDPVVMVSAVDEDAELDAARSRYGELSPTEAALLLARAKAEAVAQDIEGVLVLGCDSVLEVDGETYGKPVSAEAATALWRRLTGGSGTLHTGHWLVDCRDDDEGGTGATFGDIASTVVHFAAVDDADIDAYVATGEPLRVAGGFTIDGLGGPFIDGVEGDHHNVVGLSLPLLRRMVGQVAVRWSDLM